MRHGTSVVLFIFPLLAFSANVYAQSRAPQRSSDLGSPSASGILDSQLLEGLGEGQLGFDRAEPSDLTREGGAGGIRFQGATGPIVDGSDIGERDPLTRIGRHMRWVESLLIQGNVSHETQQTQSQIVAQLDELIKALAESQQAQSQCKQGSSSKGNRPSAKPGKKPARDGSGMPVQAGGDGPSSPTVREAVEGFWGHLPERLRRQMQSAQAIEYLPRYRKLIEDYYERLAEDR